MAAGKILGMALEAIGKGADEAAGVVKASKSAARKAVDAIADVGDDWGWKGGKPGELTGGEYVEQYEKARSVIRPKFRAGAVPPTMTELTKAEKAMDALNKKARKQLVAGGIDHHSVPPFLRMSDFAMLEQADIPRAWTGKVMKALGPNFRYMDRRRMNSLLNYGADSQNYPIPEDLVISISDTMRPLNNEQRAEFLKELPDWEDSLESLAYFVQNV